MRSSLRLHLLIACVAETPALGISEVAASRLDTLLSAAATLLFNVANGLHELRLDGDRLTMQGLLVRGTGLNDG